MNETNRSTFKKRAVALAVASCLSLSPWIAEAAGLGKLTVLSGLGQPLRAELEIGANRDELAGMTARLAPQDAFRQAGIDYATALLDLRFVVERRASGQPVVKVTSSKPVNEPFLDFLVELNWPAGRLVREYTFLLDPPEIALKQAARPVAEARVVETVQGGAAVAERQPPVKAALRPAAPAPRPAPAPKKAEVAGTRVVQTGDTLRKIAAETKYEGVSLEQMLVGIFQKNPDAFIGNNINRVKAGAILGIPDQAAVEAVSEAEAKKVYVAQSGDWNAYRQKLAAATAKGPAKDEAASQSSSGKISAKVEDKAAPAEQSKDQVKVSRTEMAAKGAAGGKTADAEAERIAKEKALKEAQERLAMLEKNVGDLQKLVDLKNQKLAELQQQSAKKEETKPAEAAKPAEPPKPVEAAKSAEPPKPVESPKPVEAPKVAEAAKTAEPEKPAEAPKPVATPAPAVKKPPAPEPVEVSIFDDPLPLLGGGGVIALLAGYLLFKRRRSSTEAPETAAVPGASTLGPNSVFRMTGGQSVDTGNTPPQTGDFSQTGPGTIDTDEVDPVAEADVYMAYGRDTQAEEILLEALQKDPQRTAIHAKLLEIYANRKSLKQFETLAGELYAQTGGVGAEWEKVAALGVGLDPTNPLYSGARGQAPAPAFDADATMIVSPAQAGRATLAMPGALAQLAESAAAAEVATADPFENDTLVLPESAEIGTEPEVVEAAPVDDGMSLDFDLGLPAVAPEAPVEAALPLVGEPYVDTLDTGDGKDVLDFDLGGEIAAPVTPAAELQLPEDLTVEAVDFDLNIAEPAVMDDLADATPDFSPEGTLVMPSAVDAVSAYIGLGDSPAAEAEPAVVEEPPMVDFDLDIGSPITQTVVNPVADSDATATLVDAGALRESIDADNPKLLETMVNSGADDGDSLEFDVKLTDSVFLGQPMMVPEFDIGSINLDLGAEPAAAEPVRAEPAAELPEAAPVQDGHWEEVNTKLDLAKAYEEMGDLEGARELLQEVVGEGSPDLVEQARAILGRIGE